MYLLMLLATFMASIYGYNLSARPDYDRDVARKKAAAVIFKFNHQFGALQKLAEDVYHGNYETSDSLPWALPEDMMYSPVDAEEDIFYYQNGDEITLSLRDAGGRNYLANGRPVYDYTEMATKLICLDENKELQESDAANCTPEADDEGNITESCCSAGGQKFIISYKKLDARWINRASGDVSLDFMNALADEPYYENLGVIHWENGAWQFRGKINFRPVYVEDETLWEEQHQDDLAPYPSELRNRSEWTMPQFFAQGYFKTKGDAALCTATQPCLVKIQSL